MPLTTEIVRTMIRDELIALGLIPAPEPKGLPVVFKCSCGSEACKQELHVVPWRSEGRKVVHLRILSPTGGLVLDQDQRDSLAEILNDKDWHGDRADLRA